MKYIIFSFFILSFISSCSDKATNKKKTLSPPATAMAMVGDAHIHIDYSSPGVRGRTFFGDLLPYGKLWRAGAGDATWIESNKDLLIDGQTLPAGKYGFFAIPDKETWTLIFNTNWDQHGTDDYKSEEDVLKIEVQASKLEKLQEHLEYKVTKNSDQSGVISLAWEKTKVEFPFKVLSK